jgi:putative peptide zinc metalloprotease protein
LSTLAPSGTSKRLLAATRPAEAAQALAARHGSPDTRPAIREDLAILRQVQMGEIVWIVKNPETMKYFQFKDPQWAIIKLFDGTRTPVDILDEINRHTGGKTRLEFVLEYEEFLRDKGLIQQTAAERSLGLLDKFKTLRGKKADEKTEGFNIFFIMFHLVDPDRFLTRTVKYVRWIWSPPVVLATLAASVWTVAVFARNWEAIWTGSMHLYHFFGKPLVDILQFFFIISIIGAVHEYSHGYVCKMYGGEVRDIGFALFYLMPAFYCDTSDAYLFANRLHRLWVTVAGIYIEVIVCTIATALWVLAYPDTLLSQLAYKTMLFTGVSAVFFNINPLIKVDGYYALSSLLLMPDLREGAWHTVGAWFQKTVMRLPVELPVTTRRKRRIYFVYGALSMAYTATIMFLIYRLLDNFYSKFFPDVGVVFLVFSLYYIFRKKTRTLMRVSKLVYLDKKELLMSRRSRLPLAILGSAFLLVVAIPWSHRTIRAEAAAKPLSEAVVMSPEEGVVTEVFAGEGDSVERGQPLFRIESPSLEEEKQRSLAQTDRFTRKSSANRALANAPLVFEAQTRAAAARTNLENAEYRKTFLLVRSPIKGRILTPRTQDLAGRQVAAGFPLARVGDCTKMAVELPVSERLLQYLRQGASVVAQIRTRPLKVYRGSLASISTATLEQPVTSGAEKEPVAPSAVPDRFIAVAVFDNPDGTLLPGSEARLKIQAPRESYAFRAWKAIRYRFQTVVW